MSIEFKDNSLNVKEALGEEAIAFLLEAVAEVHAQTVRNSRVDTGQTKDSWRTAVDEDNLTGYVGSNYENAIWEEFGTGEYALNGNGRKTPWFYVDRHGKGHFTHGKKPHRTLHKAFTMTEETVKRLAEYHMRRLNDR